MSESPLKVLLTPTGMQVPMMKSPIAKSRIISNTIWICGDMAENGGDANTHEVLNCSHSLTKRIPLVYVTGSTVHTVMFYVILNTHKTRVKH